MSIAILSLVDDSDFFGGQQYLWQAKMFEHFGILLPDIWRLQGAPQFNINPDDGWVGLNITTKLRFCCRVRKKILYYSIYLLLIFTHVN